MLKIFTTSINFISKFIQYLLKKNNRAMRLLLLLIINCVYSQKDLNNTFKKIRPDVTLGHTKIQIGWDQTNSWNEVYPSKKLKSNDNSLWEQKGPELYGVHKIVINRSGHIFINTGNADNQATHEIFRSIDNGSTWTKIQDATLIYINPDGYIFSSLGNDLFRSSDNGFTWQKTSGIATNLIINDKNNILYCVFYGTDKGVYQSDDKGLNWKKIGDIPSGSAFDFAYSTTGGFFICGGTAGTVYRSTDYCKNWTATALLNPPVDYPYSLAVNSKGDVFVGSIGNNKYGIFRSTNNGQSWEHLPLSIVNSVWEITIKPDDNLLVGTGLCGVERSMDNGNSWMTLNIYFHFDGDIVRTIAVDSSNHIWAGSQGGLYKSDSNDFNWKKINVPAKSTACILSLIYSFDGKIFTGTDRTGLYRSTNYGTTWDLLGLQQESINALALDNSRNLLVGTYRLGLFSSSNIGENAKNIGMYSIEAILVTKNNSILAGLYDPWASEKNKGIYRSTDGGQSWNSTELSYPCFTIRQNLKGTIFSGHEGGISRSTDDGLTWLKIFNKEIIFNIEINSSNIIFASGDNGLYYSLNEGDNWIKVSNELMSNLRGICFNSSLHVFVTSLDKGIFKSIDGSYNNFNLDNSLASYRPFRIISDNFDNIYVGTLYSGIFKNMQSIASTTKVNDRIPVSFNLSQNYPNPFNPETKIEYSVPEESFVELEIFDYLGREVQTPIKETQKAGVYSHIWKPRNLPSGVYYYKILAGKFSEIKKMIYIR